MKLPDHFIHGWAIEEFCFFALARLLKQFIVTAEESF